MLDNNGSLVVTLGPEGTDAHAEATRRFTRVLLVPSFRNAMNVAYQRSESALVPAGFVELSADRLVESWIGLHFEYYNRMDLLATWHASTKPMCVAVNDRVADDRPTVALHPATLAFANAFGLSTRREFVPAKPLAAQLAAEGKVTTCIASVDVVEKYQELRIVHTFKPKMVWCLYGRCQGSADSTREGE